MAKFKVGDRVHCPGPDEGLPGTVVEVEEECDEYYESYFVEWDDIPGHRDHMFDDELELFVKAS